MAIYRCVTQASNVSIMYTNSAGVTCYGRLEKVLIIECADQVFNCVCVSEYSRTSKGLCKDTITNAKKITTF